MKYRLEIKDTVQDRLESYDGNFIPMFNTSPYGLLNKIHVIETGHDVKMNKNNPDPKDRFLSDVEHGKTVTYIDVDGELPPLVYMLASRWLDIKSFESD